MKPWRNLSEVELPMNMRHLPRDERGYPIPHLVTVGTDGKPDFRVMDAAKTVQAIKHRLCGICGRQMKGDVCFVGGPLSIQNRTFTDSPMHAACARYSMQVCPFIAAPKFAYARADIEVAGHVTHTNPQVSTQRPDIFGLGIASDYSLALMGGEPVLLAWKWKHLEWWRHGVKLKEEPCQTT